MILTVTLNACIDVTYHAPAVALGQSCRVGAPMLRAGGKGINVARVLADLDRPSTVLGFIGNEGLDLLRTELVGVDEQMTMLAHATRRTVTVVEPDTDRTTVLLEDGPPIGASEWDRLVTGFEEQLVGADTVVISGSAPPGAPEDCCAQLTRRAHAHGARVILDTSGARLREGIEAEPDLIAPNLEEFSAAFCPAATDDPATFLPAARELARSVGTVVITLGERGAFAVTHDTAHLATPGQIVRGNPTGAGDAFVAGLVEGMALQESVPQMLARATGCGAAAVRQRTAGVVTPAHAARERDSAHVHPLSIASTP